MDGNKFSKRVKQALNQPISDNIFKKMRTIATVKFQGRLANNIYQIANLIAYARKNGMDYYIPEYSEHCLQNKIEISCKGTSPVPPKETTLYNEPIDGFGNPFYSEIPYIENSTLVGFFQSFKYFDDYKNEIKEVCHLTYNLSNMGYVGIHVRRGDYVNSDSFRVLPIEYYIAAINYFTILGYKKYLIYTDDYSWSAGQFFRLKQILFTDCDFYLPNGNGYDHLIKMSWCEHQIVANSSFSFLAAWLNENPNKIVMCPAYDHMFKTCNKDMIPDEWAQLYDTGVGWEIKNSQTTALEKFDIPTIELPNITILAVATKNVEKTVRALIYSCRNINYGAVKLVSHYKPNNLPDYIQYEQVHQMADIDEWNNYIFYHLWKHIDTEFGLLIHDDGYVVHPECWKPEFLNYDYIGAGWSVQPDIMKDVTGTSIRVGNSVSIRSKKLMRIPIEKAIAWRKYEGNYNEDTQICIHNRHIFIEAGCKFAPIELAVHFAQEEIIPEMKGIKPFAFHKHFTAGHPNFKYHRV